MSDLTVFVGTFNRVDTLAHCLALLEHQRHPKRIVIVDNGSRWTPAVDYLTELEGYYTIYRMPSIEDVPVEEGDAEAHGGHGMMAVERNYSQAFRQEYEADLKTRWYAVCDCDSAPDGLPDSIERYLELAKSLGCAVGPHLSLNIGRNYPLRSAALILNARVLFRERMSWFKDIPYSHDEIDSTFHLFPSAPSFDRLGMQTVRVGPSWWTTHTDWLIDALSPTPENQAYILGSESRWGGIWIREWFQSWLRSPREAFEFVERAPRTVDNYDWPRFILSWMLQHGHGCERDLVYSRTALRDAFPIWSPCWEYEQHWDALVYDDDQTCLGWS